jgi:hypothetical protein
MKLRTDVSVVAVVVTSVPFGLSAAASEILVPVILE